MAELKDGKVTQTTQEFMEQIKAQVRAELLAEFKAKEPAPQPEEDAEASRNKLKAEAIAKAWPHHWRAFRSSTGAVGVAYVNKSKTHLSGRVIKFEAFEKPPEEQFRDPCPIPREARFLHGDMEQPSPKYAAWVYSQALLLDSREYVGAEADSLPDVGPPRASLEDAMTDLPERRIRRDEAFHARQVLKDPTVRHATPDLPAVVPVKK